MIEEKYLGIKNRIFYKRNSFNPKRQTLVFVHGLSGSSSAWINYEKYFEKKFNILTFDLRGHGKSFRPKREEEYLIKNFSKDIYRLVKKEKISNFILIGHSFGNFIVLDFFKRYKNLVKALVLISADAAPAKRKLTKIILPFLWLSKLLNYFPGIKKEGGHLDYSRYLHSGDWNIRRIIADVSNTGLRSFLFSTYQIYKFDMEDSLREIKVPTLIIHGNKDTIFPINSGMKINNSIKNSKFVVFKNSNHIIVLNDFTKLSTEINKFVNGLK